MTNLTWLYLDNNNLTIFHHDHQSWPQVQIDVTLHVLSMKGLGSPPIEVAPNNGTRFPG